MAQEKELFGYNIKTIKPKGKIVYEYNPLYNYRPDDLNGEIDDLITTGSSQLNFDLEHPVDIVCQKSYDGSVNLILNDNKNQPRLINTRFTAKENNTYERIDRTGNTDTNLYDESEFEIDTSLLKKYINIPKVNFSGVFYGGNLQVGNYTFYFKLSDGDGNETDIVAESGVVTIHMGSLNDPASIRGGQFNENSGKSIQFIITNLDSGYDYVSVYYSRTSGADNLQRSVQAVKILNRYRIRQNVCSIHITGNELSEIIPVETLSQDFFLASAAKTQEVCQNMLFLGNVQKYTPDYETLVKLSLGFIPYYKAVDEETELGSTLNETYNPGGYYNVQNIYNKVGYWNEEIYRFGVVYIMSNGSLSPVYNIRGRNNVPAINDPNADGYDNWDEITVDYDTQLINNFTLENSAGVCRIFDNNEHDNDYFQVRHFIFKAQDGLLDELKNLNIKGYFFVRQKRIPTILCQAFMIGKDSYSGIPAWFLKDGNSSTSGKWVTESFLDSRGYVTHEYGRRLMLLGENHTKTSVGICPEFEMNQAYYNNIFTGGVLKLRQVTSNEFSLGGEQNHIFINTSGKYTLTNSTPFIKAKVTSVPDSGLVRDGNNIFRNVAGSANENTFQYLVGKTTKPRKKNFDVIETNITFTNGQPNIPNYIQEHKVKIVRGLYSPYLGIYNTNLLKPNSLVNIYIPGYDTGDMQEYFKIRINCEDSYYPVSPRTSLDEFPENGEHIYRGDCFISQFTHRINRNFQDPDAPCNDTIVEEDTWREKYDEDTDSTEDINRGDLNAVRIGTYLTMKCYSSINLAMRDWDGSFPSEEALTGNKRSFYPLSSFRVDGHGKIPESVMFNQGFNATTGERMNFLQPPVPYIKNIFQTRVIYSDIAQTDAFKNGFRVFKGISYVDYSNQYGGITKLVEWRGNLIIVFEHGVALAAVNEKALIPTDDGTQIAVGAVKPLATTPVMISTDFGSQWPESICKSDNYIYGVDTVSKKIWRTDGTKLECISDFKVQKFLNENITLSEKELTPVIGVRNVKTHYNAFKHDVMFTYYDNTYGFEEKVWNLCWNELQQAFVTFYSWIPSYSANIDNIYFTYDRNSSKWITKLSQSTYGNENASGVCMQSPLIENNSFQEELHLANRPLPEGEINRDYYLAFELIRDNFGFWQYFDIVQTKVSSNVIKSELEIKTGKYNDLLEHWFLIAGQVKDPIIPCVQLNIRCNLSVVEPNSDPSGWSQYQVSNAGYYESQVFLTLKDIYENTSRVRNEDGRWVSETLNTVDVYADGTSPTPEPFAPDWRNSGGWVLGTATSRINTGISYNKNNVYEVKFLVDGINFGFIICAGNSWNVNDYFNIMLVNTNNSTYVRVYKGVNVIADYYVDNGEHTIISSLNSVILDGIPVSTGTDILTISNDIYIGPALFSPGNIAKIKSIKIKDSVNNIIFEAYPAIDQNDVSCVYDYATESFLYNQGTGNLLVSPEVQQEATRNTNIRDNNQNVITVQLPTFETKFWKHGFAGLIDAQDKIRPCFWYGKQHPFEFEYVVGNDNAGYKQFDNLQISSNNVAPESIHYTIIGDSYDFALQKSAMYFRQEATKALYQYNGSDLLYDHAVFDPITGYLPQMITSSDYIERDRSGNPLRGNAAVSTSYKDTLFPIIYMSQDTFNEVEDFYKRIIASLPYSDYPNITGGEILWDQTLDQFSICNHVKCRDIKEVGRSRGNIQYVNDKWNIQISPLIVLNRNNTWLKKNNTWLPKLVLANVPKEVYDYTQGQLTDNDFPPEISNIGYDTTLLDGTPWDSIANKRTEVKLLDKVLKTKIRYKGDKLVIVLATATSFNTIA